MEPLSLDEVAAAAGVSRDEALSFVTSGVLRPDEHGAFRPPDVARVRLVAALVRSGLLDLDALAAALADGRLSLRYVDHLMPDPVRLVRVPPGTDQPGVLDLEHAVQPILGTNRSAADPIRADDLAILTIVARAVELGAPIDRVVRIVRSIARAAATLVDLQREFVDDVLLDPAIERTGSPIGALEETARVRLEYRELGRRLSALLMERLVDDAIFKNLVQLTEFALASGDLQREPRAETVVFLDVSEYTRLSERYGDQVSADQAALLVDVVTELAARHDSRLVKSLGDGAMVHSRDVSGGVALALDAAVAPRATQLWPLHVGVNTGPLVHRDGDLYGTTVNVASRVADHAGPGEVVVTGSVVDAYRGDDVAFSPIGAVSLKNVGEPVALFTAERVPE